MLGLGYGVDPSGLTEEEMRKELTALLPKAVRRAGRNAVNRTITSLRMQASKYAREDLALKAATAKDAISIKRARRGSEPSGEVLIEPKSISLKRYGARNTNKGVTVKVRKSSGRKVLKHGFLPPSLDMHPFKRAGDKRLPILKRYGPSVRVELEQYRDELDEHRRETFKKRFREQANWEIDKARH